MNIIRNELPPTIPQGYVAIDSEWWALNLKTIHRPTSGRFACLTIATSPDDVYWISDPKLVEPALQRVNDAVWLMHNGKFDFTHLRRICPIPDRTKFVDTMLMERIMYGGYYDRFAEDDLVRRYLSEYMDKTLQKSFGEDLGEMSEAQVEYSCLDVSKLFRVWGEQKKNITKTHMNLWKTVDMPMMWTVLDMMGFRMDVDRWLKIAEENKARSAEIDATLPFNPRSPKQVLDVLRKAGFKGLPSTGEEVVMKWRKKYPDSEAARWVDRIYESRGLTKQAGTYGKDFIDDFLEEGNTVFADWHIIGAETSRMAARNPHMQTIPTRETKVYRECFIAREGNQIVVGDWSQQEFFIAAYVSQDPVMIDICRSGEDIYVGMAKIMYDEIIKKTNPLRKRMKSVVLGMDYGMSEYGLAEKEGITVDEAVEVLLKFRKKFPKFALWMDQQQREKRKVHTVLDREIYLNPYSNQCPRNALNGPMQGTAADMLKRAAASIRRKWKQMFTFPFGLVAPIHDELVFDAPKEHAKDVANLVQTEMERVANEMCPGLGFRSDVKTGDTWACKGE